MKSRISLVLCLLIMALFVISNYCYAESLVASKSINVSASVSGINTLAVQLYNISPDVIVPGINPPITFGSKSSSANLWSTLPNEYLKIIVTDNAVAWRIRIYTDNFTSTPSTTTWGYQYGGLVGPSGSGAKVPMAWLCNPNTITNGPSVGDPQNGTTNGWTYLKDKSDVDDPGTAYIEDFNSSDTSGYTNIAFGTAGSTRIVRPNIPAGSEELSTPTSPFCCYLEGNFNGAAATSYSTTLTLELLNQ